MKAFVRFFLLLNLICKIIHTNEDRIHEGELSKKNEAALICLLISNVFFGLEVLCSLIARGCIFERMTYLRKPWNMLNFIVTLSRYCDNS